MIRTKFILIIWLVGYNLIYSQPNLILNPSFEHFDSCSVWAGNIGVASSWYNGNKNGTSDYYNPCNAPIVSIPLNQIGYQFPQDSQSYAGLGFGAALDLREAIVGKLSISLMAGHHYCVNMHINVANRVAYTVDQLSIYFSKDSVIADFYNSNNNILIPQLDFDISGITDTLNWTNISGKFIASGNEDFFIISNFQNSPNWYKFNLSNDTNVFPDQVTYYYIDNITLVDCTPPDIVLPNLLSPNGDGINDKYVILNLPPDSRVSFFNRWGNELYSTNDYQNEWDGKYMGNLLPTGTYFVVVQFSDGTTKGTFIELMY